jgi:uncharacterized RmlC-like cupin family protein
MAEYSPVRIVSPAEFDPGTAQTPGSERLAAVAPQLGIQSALWGGLFEVKPGARTGIHHHGEQETIAYVLSGGSAGAREANMLGMREPAISSMCLPTSRTWRSIRRIRSLFTGQS